MGNDASDTSKRGVVVRSRGQLAHLGVRVHGREPLTGPLLV
jgi:hypothetical protein